jgi:hypothetical protein
VLHQQWIDALRWKDFVPSKSAVVCSKHFKEEDIDRTSLSCVRIRIDAVSTVFEAFPSYLVKKKTSRKPPRDRSTAAESAAGVTNEPLLVDTTPSSSSGPSTVATVCSDDIMDTPRKAVLKRKLSDAQNKLTSSRKKIKLLQQSKRRLLKRTATLKSVITDLRSHNLLSTDSLSVLENAAGSIGDLLKRQMD